MQAWTNHTLAEPESKPYHAIRSHNKSRLGCKNCKTRRVKCDEERPFCKRCTVRAENCVYDDRSSVRGKASSTPRALCAKNQAGTQASKPGVSTSRYDHESDEATGRSAPWLSIQVETESRKNDDQIALTEEPMFKLPSADATDMMLLWHYTAITANSFSVQPGRMPALDEALQVKVIECAFSSPFLMNCVLGLAAMHRHNLRQSVPRAKCLKYRADAFTGYRKAIEDANPTDSAALMAGSLFLCALSSDTFRQADSPKLYILDWMMLWRGIGIVIDMLPKQTLASSGMQMIFTRPSTDLNKAAPKIPNDLLLMLASIKPDDKDHEYIITYYKSLQYLGALYLDLDDGFTPILNLRIVTFFTFLPTSFVDLAKERRPRALIILAHYLAFTKLVINQWWYVGIAQSQIPQIAAEIGPEWNALLEKPMAVVNLTDRLEVTRVLLGDYSWEPAEAKHMAWDVQAPGGPKVTVVDDAGQEVERDENGEWALVDLQRRRNNEKPTWNVDSNTHDPLPNYPMPGYEPHRQTSVKGVDDFNDMTGPGLGNMF